MATDTRALNLKLVRQTDSVELDMLPLQGLWTEQQYLRLTDQTNNLIEFTEGKIEVLPMPTRRHQVIMLLLYDLLKAFLKPRGGTILVAPFRLQVRPDKFREPDILLLMAADDPRNQEAYWLGADMVLEVVSEGDPERDTRIKRVDYAEGGVPEYWIVNPIDETIAVLRLEHETYAEHGVFRRGGPATSLLLDGFSVGVDQVFDAQ